MRKFMFQYFSIYTSLTFACLQSDLEGDGWIRNTGARAFFCRKCFCSLVSFRGWISAQDNETLLLKPSVLVCMCACWMDQCCNLYLFGSQIEQLLTTYVQIRTQYIHARIVRTCMYWYVLDGSMLYYVRIWISIRTHTDNSNTCRYVRNTFMHVLYVRACISTYWTDQCCIMYVFGSQYVHILTIAIRADTFAIHSCTYCTYVHVSVRIGWINAVLCTYLDINTYQVFVRLYVCERICTYFNSYRYVRACIWLLIRTDTSC